MSFTDRLWLWLHVAFVIFAIGPATAAIMATPRQIRAGNVAVLRHLLRATRVYSALTLGAAAFGVALGESQHELGKAWLTVSMTLFVVALVCLLLIMRDQSRALLAMESAARYETPVAATSGPDATAAETGAGEAATRDGTDRAAAVAGSADPAAAPADPASIANVERGRIASLGGLVALIWLVVLVLMVWQP